MNIPFKLSLTTSNNLGILWNGWGTSAPASSVNNAILSQLTQAQQIACNLLPPLPPVWVTSIVCMGDTASAYVSLGYYDTQASAFVELYANVSTVVAGGGFVRPFVQESGIYLPLSKFHLPVIKLVSGAASVELTGDIGVFPDMASFGPGQLNSSGPTISVLDDPTGSGITDETGSQIFSEP